VPRGPKWTTRPRYAGEVPTIDSTKAQFKRRWVLIVAGVAVLTAVGVGALVGFGALDAPHPEQAAIRQTVEQGLLAQQDAISVPASGRPMGAAATAQFKSQVRDRLAQYFTGSALANFVNVEQANVDNLASGSVRYLAGGADNLQFQSISIKSASATVHATASMWAKIETLPSPGDNSTPRIDSPRADTIINLTLVKVGADWLIQSESLEPASGQAP
jgi:hypothetical protein